jgi:precorrin-2/cobalt-factor-2 C20-methyltransferase
MTTSPIAPPGVLGRLSGVGVGPGDPELMTLKAARLIRTAAVVAYFAKRGNCSIARTIAADHIHAGHVELPLAYPLTTETPVGPLGYEEQIQRFYDDAADAVATHLGDGRDVVVLCEGDPFFYGSFMYLYDRLSGRFQTEVVPGVSSVMACSAALGQPLTYRDDVLTVIPGTLPDTELKACFDKADAVAVMKLGRNFTKVRAVLTELGLADRARYVERATMARQRILPLQAVDPDTVPYFSMIVLPSRRAGRG